MIIGFEYRWAVIMEKLNVVQYQFYGAELIHEYCAEVRTRDKIYWFILSGATANEFVYKLVYKGALRYSG